jgi:cobalt-precorrin 5A hydrolase
MERAAMRVAGMGFRAGATGHDLVAALARVEGADAVDALATLVAKAADLQRVFPQRRVIGVAVAGVDTPTRSPRIEAMHGTGSVAEAAALVAAGPGARLVSRRQVIYGVTIALAETQSEPQPEPQAGDSA